MRHARTSSRSGSLTPTIRYTGSGRRAEVDVRLRRQRIRARVGVVDDPDLEAGLVEPLEDPLLVPGVDLVRAAGWPLALRAGYSATAWPSRLPTMPQHSLGASSRAWATIWSSSERAIRIRRRTLAGRSGALGSDALSEVISSSSSSLELPLMASLNSRIPLPIDLPTSGKRFGPRMTRAMTSTITSSSGPTLNGMSLPRPFEWVTGQGIGSPAGFVGIVSGVWPSAWRRTTRCCAPPAITAATVRSASSARQPAPDQLVARDRGALELRQLAQRRAGATLRAGRAAAPSTSPGPACSRTGTVSANSIVSNAAACARSCSANRSASARSAPASGPRGRGGVRQRRDLLDGSAAAMTAPRPCARRRSSSRNRARSPVGPRREARERVGHRLAAPRPGAEPRCARPRWRRAASRARDGRGRASRGSAST